MSIEIYPADYSTRYQLTHAISIQMFKYYNDTAKCTIVVPVSDYNINMMKVGGLIYDTERNITYIIANVKTNTNDNRITVNGFTADKRLNERVIAAAYTMSNVEAGTYELINNNLRGMTRISTAAATGMTETSDTLFESGQLLDKLQPVLQEVEIGYRMAWNPTTLQHVFTLYKGADKTTGIHAVRFSEEQGTCTDLVINEDNSTFKNVAYVPYRLSNGTESVRVVGTATGDERRELYISSRQSQTNDETESAFYARLDELAATELAKHIFRKTFSVSIDASEMGILYDIGDVVTCVSVRFGVSFNARITGLKYTLDVTGEKTQIILGDPILTAIGELKLNGNY